MSLIKHTSLVLAGLWASLSTAQGVPAYNDAFIVECDPSNNVARHDNFLSSVVDQVSRLGPSCQASPRRTFDSPHFTGASFDLKCDDTLDQLKVLGAIRKTAGVGKAWPVGHVKHQMALPGQGAKGWAGSKRDGSFEQSAAPKGLSVDGFSTHKMGNVDRLHDKGITGAGIKIAVVDSGFDTSVHGLSETKITYSVDITGEFKDATDNCSMHGTHVLGIVGAKSADNMYNVSGVAPDATYELYRIQKCGASEATTDDLIAGFTQAANRGVDIITCSFGGSGAFPEEPWSLAATRIAATGIYVSLPAGNSGPGPFTGNVPATAPLVSSTGAADNVVQPCIEWQGSITKNGQTEPFSFVPGGELNFPDTPLTLWSPVAEEIPGSPANCSLITNEPPKDPANTIAVVNGRQCFVDSDGVNIGTSKKYNIQYFIYYMPKAPEGQQERCPDWGQSGYSQTKGSMTTEYTFGSPLLPEIAKGHTITVKVPSNPTAGKVSMTNRASSSGGSITWYSSWGPTWDGRTMPTYLAPGNDILSTFPKRLGSWGVIGGTSMATPYAAGVAALLKQQFPKMTSGQIQSILATAAQPIKFNDRQFSYYTGPVRDFYAPILQQGGGLLDAYAASNTKTLLNVTSLSFNDTANRVHSTTVEISNTGTQELTYTLHHVGAASGYFLNTTGGNKYQFTYAMGLPVYADLKFEPSSLTLGPGKTASVSVSVAAEPHLPDGVSYFGGYVAINATGKGGPADHLTIPYTGFGGNLVSIPAINKDQTYGGPINLTINTVTREGDGRVYTCDYNQTASTPCTYADGLYPALWATVLTGASRNMTISLIDHKTGAAVLPNDMAIGSWVTWGLSNYWYWDGSDLNRTFVPAGDYFWRVSVLRLNGDVADAKAWDIVDLAWWTLKYTANSILPKQ
ncbi:hypothetical protein PspLS_04048 [Pyricularia sp. CBS 133598]|nr:hypothetical protein PspLS_04048 [Pyricularia sp. CBS 133598]